MFLGETAVLTAPVDRLVGTDKACRRSGDKRPPLWGFAPRKATRFSPFETGHHRSDPASEPLTRRGRRPSTMKRNARQEERRPPRPRGCERLARRNRLRPTRPSITTRSAPAVANLQHAPQSRRTDGPTPNVTRRLPKDYDFTIREIGSSG